ncbi:MAG TPA: hypothetical protein VH165_16135, partial [Kofleriaceae bacterium]|nr:hypothetical protein [Kofleriaceae bacterium]
QGQQNKDQQAQGQQNKDRQAQGQQNKDQQGQQNKAADAPDAAATAPKPSAAGTPGQAHDPGTAAAAAAAADDAKHRAAGELTRGEAVQLLDSVERDLKPMAIHGRASHPTQTTKTKDW